MPFLDWKEIEDAQRLAMIEAGASMCLRHASRLLSRPGYQTLAEDYLQRAEKALRRSLIEVRRARVVYQRKRVDA